MALYHLNPSTGEYGPCHAQSPASCPFGGDSGENHYKTETEAKAAAEGWARALAALTRSARSVLKKKSTKAMRIIDQLIGCNNNRLDCVYEKDDLLDDSILGDTFHSVPGSTVEEKMANLKSIDVDEDGWAYLDPSEDWNIGAALGDNGHVYWHRSKSNSGSEEDDYVEEYINEWEDSGLTPQDMIDEAHGRLINVSAYHAGMRDLYRKMGKEYHWPKDHGMRDLFIRMDKEYNEDNWPEAYDSLVAISHVRANECVYVKPDKLRDWIIEQITD